MADYCTICLLGAMDRLWFYQVILSSEHTTLSNNLKIPEQPNTLICTACDDDLLEDSSTKSSVTPLNPTCQKTKSTTRSTYSGPRMRLQKTMSCKTLLELELEEVKGFMDLGFKFNKENLSPVTISLVPGLQRITWPKKDDEAKLDDDEEIYEEELEDDDSEESDSRRVMRPYLSEAWLIKRPESPLLNLKLPKEYANVDMKKHLRYWARTVASIIQQES